MAAPVIVQQIPNHNNTTQPMVFSTGGLGGYQAMPTFVLAQGSGLDIGHQPVMDSRQGGQVPGLAPATAPQQNVTVQKSSVLPGNATFMTL
jgi:hypothetical protein